LERNQRLARRMAWVARIVALITAIFLAIMVIGSAAGEIINDEPVPFDIEGVTLGIITVFALAGCIVSWWRERLAATLLVIVSIGLAIHIGISAGRNHVLAWTMMGLPYLIAGALFFGSWRISKNISQQ
jgi:hypothetical protein